LRLRTLLALGFIGLVGVTIPSSRSINPLETIVLEAGETINRPEDTNKKTTVCRKDLKEGVSYLFLTLAGKNPEHLAVARNLVRILSPDGREGTGVFVNPYQILTAEHVVNSPTQKYNIVSSLYEERCLEDEIESIETDSAADIALINLRNPMREYEGVNLYSGQTYEGMKIFVLSTDDKGSIRYREGVITNVRIENGKERIETNIPIIFGNSGGVFLTEEGDIVGTITDKAICKSIGIGSSLNSLYVIKAEGFRCDSKYLVQVEMVDSYEYGWIPSCKEMYSSIQQIK